MAKKNQQKPQRHENQHTKGKNRLFSHPNYNYNKRSEAGKKAWETRRKNEERLNQYKDNPRGERTGLSAHDKYDIIMKSLSKSQQEELRNYESGDFIDAADFVAWERGRTSYRDILKKLKEIDNEKADPLAGMDINTPLENKKNGPHRRNPF